MEGSFTPLHGLLLQLIITETKKHERKRESGMLNGNNSKKK